MNTHFDEVVARKIGLLGVVLINTWTAKLHFSALLTFHKGTMRANTIKLAGTAPQGGWGAIAPPLFCLV